MNNKKIEVYWGIWTERGWGANLDAELYYYPTKEVAEAALTLFPHRWKYAEVQPIKKPYPALPVLNYSVCPKCAALLYDVCVVPNFCKYCNISI